MDKSNNYDLIKSSNFIIAYNTSLILKLYTTEKM